MKHFLLLLLAFSALGVVIWIQACGDDDDDDDDNDVTDDDGTDDDTNDDDVVDDDTNDDDTVVDDDIDDDAGDDDTNQPYDPAFCTPGVAVYYETCHLQLQFGEEVYDQAQATESCENYTHLIWPCFIECYLDYGTDCVSFYLCVQECSTR